jgi:hypothetical protein
LQDQFDEEEGERKYIVIKSAFRGVEEREKRA